MTKKMAISSILMALSVVALFLGSIFPVSVAMSFLASAISAVVIIECDSKYAVCVFLGVSLISFLIIPAKALSYLYIAFLGYYPILKFYIEHLKNLLKEWILKIVLFNILLLLAYILFKTFFIPDFDAELVNFIFNHLLPIILGAEIIFAMYDIGLTYFIDFYNRRIRFNRRKEIL